MTFAARGATEGRSRSPVEETSSDDGFSDADSEAPSDIHIAHTGVTIPTAPVFVRYTKKWSREPNRQTKSTDLVLTKLIEEPDEAWKQWTEVGLVSPFDAVIVHERSFDVSGRKTTDQLYFPKPSPVLEFLESLYAVSAPEGESLSQADTVTEDKYKWLFFAKGSILLHLEANGHRRTLGFKPFQALVHFIGDVFHEASRAQDGIRRSGLVTYEHLWTLYPPQELVYEKRLVLPRNTPYEQCWRVRGVEEFTSFTDRGRALRLMVDEVVYGRGIRSGPRLTMSCRYIRPYTGSKPITADGLGIVPLSMLPRHEQEAIRARLSQAGRRYIDICAMPFSVMDYDGPLCLTHSHTINNTKEEMMLSSAERVVQVL